MEPPILWPNQELSWTSRSLCYLTRIGILWMGWKPHLFDQVKPIVYQPRSKFYILSILNWLTFSSALAKWHTISEFKPITVSNSRHSSFFLFLKWMNTRCPLFLHLQCNRLHILSRSTRWNFYAHSPLLHIRAWSWSISACNKTWSLYLKGDFMQSSPPTVFYE